MSATLIASGVGRQKAYNCNAVIVDVRSRVQLFLNLSVLDLRPEGRVSDESLRGAYDQWLGLTYSTPPGWRAVLLTLLATMLTALFNEEEWKLLFCCLEICSLRKLFEVSGRPGVYARTGGAGRVFKSAIAFGTDLCLFALCPTGTCLIAVKLCLPLKVTRLAIGTFCDSQTLACLRAGEVGGRKRSAWRMAVVFAGHCAE